MKNLKVVDTLKGVNWVNVGVAAVGVLGLILGGKQKQQEERLMNETIQKKVEEAIENLK